MKKYKRNATVEEFLQSCKERGWETDQTKLAAGGDHILFTFSHEGRSGSCLFNVVNGRFFGSSEMMDFTSDESTHDDEPWFQELLDVCLR